jgi:16S rRNA processing protein RimM
LNPEPQRWVTLARILRARGNRGEVAAVILTDFPERLTTMKEVYLADGKSEPLRTAVKNCWLSQNHRGQAVFHFAGCNSINEAEKYRGLEVQIPFEQRVALPDGHYFIEDLIGCSVFESPATQTAIGRFAVVPTFVLLGTVKDVEVPGEGVYGTPTLSVDTLSGELLIPLAVDICTRINTAAKRIEVTLPEGLRGLNEPD